jgi:transcriptional regulator with XRE-family HTH domain
MIMRNPNLAPGSIEAQEDLVIDAQFLLHDLMLEHNVSRAELARRLGVSKAHLTQLFKPGANPSLRKVAELFHALGEKVRLERAPAAAMAHNKGETVWTEEEASRTPPKSVVAHNHDLFAAFLRERSPVQFVDGAANDQWVATEDQYGVAV